MNSYLTHFGCRFYNKTLDKCCFSPKKVRKGDQYRAQCSSSTTEELHQQHSNDPTYILELMQRSLAELPPSYITWQRSQEIKQILKERKKQ